MRRRISGINRSAKPTSECDRSGLKFSTRTESLPLTAPPPIAGAAATRRFPEVELVAIYLFDIVAGAVEQRIVGLLRFGGARPFDFVGVGDSLLERLADSGPQLIGSLVKRLGLGVDRFDMLLALAICVLGDRGECILTRLDPRLHGAEVVAEVRDLLLEFHEHLIAQIGEVGAGLAGNGAVLSTGFCGWLQSPAFCGPLRTRRLETDGTGRVAAVLSARSPMPIFQSPEFASGCARPARAGSHAAGLTARSADATRAFSRFRCFARAGGEPDQPRPSCSSCSVQGSGRFRVSCVTVGRRRRMGDA
jgi:hypothetical protein